MNALVYDRSLRFVHDHPVPERVDGEALVRVLAAGIEVGREVEAAVEGRAVIGGERPRLRHGQAQLVESIQVELGQDLDLLAPVVEQGRGGGGVDGLIGGDEPAVVGRDRGHRMVQFAARQPGVVAAVQPDPVELAVEGVVTAAGQVVEEVGFLVDPDGPTGAGGVSRCGEGVDQVAVEVSEFEVKESILLGRSDEALAVLQELYERTVLLPGLLGLLDHHPGGAGDGIGGHHPQVVLVAVGPIEEEFGAVG